jgi:serine/threonine protein kinase
VAVPEDREAGAALVAGVSGAQMGAYLLLAPMGSGGTGMVFEAVDTRDGSPAAVKIAHDTKGWQREFMRREIAVLAQLGRHGGGEGGIVRLLDHGIDRSRAWYAMELVRGIDLAFIMQVLKGGVAAASVSITAVNEGDGGRDDAYQRSGTGSGDTQVSAAVPRRQTVAAVIELLGFFGEGRGSVLPDGRLVAVVQLVSRIARTLAHVHAQAIVHADLAPANIIVRQDGVPTLVDFGTSFYTFVDGVAREAPHALQGRHGTPGYMAPEQIRGEPLDARSDLYALGCIFYELLTGQPPFEGDVPTVQRLHLEAEIPPLSQLVPDLPAGLDDVVLGLLRKDPGRRIGFAEDVVGLLAPWLDRDAPQGALGMAAAPRLYRARLHGRTPLLETLEGHLGRAFEGRGGLVLLSGESGLGKTRLLNELGELAERRGATVIVGQGRGNSQDHTPLGDPLEPLLPAVRQLADRLALSRQPLAVPLGEALAALVPFERSLRTLAGVAGVDVPIVSPEVARERVTRALLTCLRALATERPVVLLLDDLQWADELTKAFLLSPRSRELGAERVLIVGSYRQEEVDRGFEADLERVCQEHLRLERLRRDDIAALAHDMTASATLPEGLIDEVFRASEGNPFFAAECLRSGLDLGLYRRDGEGRWHATAAAATMHAAFEAVRQSLGPYLLPRLARMSPAARRVAQVAAVLGREFDGDALLSLLPEATAEATRAALEELLAQRLLEEPQFGRLRFVHDKLREGCEEIMSAAERRFAHRSAAVALEALHGERPPAALAAQLGRHWAGAGEPERAAARLEHAARAFAEVHAADEASELYRQALEQLDLAVASPTSSSPATAFAPERARLAEALGDLLALRAKHAEARERYRQAEAWRAPGECLARARLLRKAGRSFWTIHQYDEASRALDRAKALLDEASAGTGERDALELARERIETMQNEFWIAYFSRRLGPAVDDLLGHMELETARFGTVRQRGIYEKCAAMHELLRARFRSSAEVIEHSRRSLALLASVPAYATDALEAQFSLGFALVNSTATDCEEALPLLHTCAERAQDLGDSTNLARALAYATIALRRLHRVADTVAMAERLRRTAGEAQLLPYLGVAASCLAWAEWRRSERRGDRRWLAARTGVDEAREWWDRAGHPFPFRWLAELVAVALAAEADDLAGAVEPLTVLGRSDQLHLPDTLDTAITAARIACEASDLERAPAALQAVIRAARRTSF